MGNSSSRRKTKEYSISPGEDAVQALITSTSISSLQDNTIFQNDSFFSLDPCERDDNHPDSCCSRFVTGTEETPEFLNSSNLHTSFFASLILGRNKHHQTASQTLTDAVNSHRWSIQCPEYVALCASFILSILQTYGQCIPQDKVLISQKSVLMFNALDYLHGFLSEMKQNSWHVDGSSIRSKSCRDCDIRRMVLIEVNFHDGSTNKLCLICLQFASFCKTDTHNKLKTWLLSEIYSYCCSKCQLRFSTKVDLQNHCCPNVHVDSKAELTTLFCCFLCRTPFKTEKDLTMHSHSSLEHALRREVAMELALRNTAASDKLFDLEMDSDLSLTNNTSSKQSVYEETIIETTIETKTSSPGVSDALYYCSPCSTFVPKSNVVDHERGSKHRLKCDVWAISWQKKSKDPCQKFKIPSENKSTPISKSKLPSKDASTSMYDSEYERVDQQVEKLVEEFFGLEKDQVLNLSAYYVCIKCSFQGEMFEMLSHRLVKHQSISCCNVESSGEALEVLEEKLRILTTLLSLCAVNQMYDLLKLISMDAVQRLIDTICFKKGNYGHDDKLSKFDKSDDDSMRNKSTSVTASNDGSYNNYEKNLEELCRPQLSGDNITLPDFTSDVHEELNKQLDNTEFTPNGAITEEDVKEATNKYFLLEMVKKSMFGCFLCERCGLEFYDSQDMMNHLFGKGHMKPKNIESQTISTLEEKLLLMEFFELAQSQKCGLVSHISKTELNFCQSITRVVIRMKKLTESEKKLPTMLELPCAEVKSCEGPDTSNIQTKDLVSSTSQLSPLVISGTNNTACSSTETSILHYSEMRNETEECASLENRITIGDTCSVSLQEQMQNACAGRDLSDFELECETCGGVFQIFNDDVDFSLDMHIQTDPQHALATAVPVERNAKSEAEFASVEKCTKEHSKPKISESKKNKLKLLDPKANNSKQVSDDLKNKEKLIKEVLKLEQKYVMTKQDKYCCQMCQVEVKTESQITHHILSPRHMSPKWMRQHTGLELYLKLRELNSLLKYRYACTHLNIVIGSINKYLGNPPKPQPLSVVEQPYKESQTTFSCDICKTSMTIGSKSAHLRGKRHLANKQHFKP